MKLHLRKRTRTTALKTCISQISCIGLMTVHVDRHILTLKKEITVKDSLDAIKNVCFSFVWVPTSFYTN